MPIAAPEPRAAAGGNKHVRERRTPGYGSMVSLLDVLFILLFASSIQAAAAMSRTDDDEPAIPDAGIDAMDAGPRDAGASDAAPLDAGIDTSAEDAAIAHPQPTRTQVFQQAIAQLAFGLKERGVVYAKVSATGMVTALERTRAGEVLHLGLGVPLLEQVPDPDVALAYLGDRAPALRVCAIVRERLGTEDLSGYLVVIIPEVPLASLSVALFRGLTRDQQRCLDDQRGIAVLVDPAVAVKRKVP